MVADSAVQSAWNWEMECLSWLLRMPFSFLKRPPMVLDHMCPNRVNWKNLVSTVIRMPVPIRSTRAGTPHTTLLTLSLIWAIVCAKLFMSCLPFRFVINE